MHKLIRKLIKRFRADKEKAGTAVYVPALAIPLHAGEGRNELAPVSPKCTELTFRCAVLGAEGPRTAVLRELGEHDPSRSSSFCELYSGELLIGGQESKRAEVELWSLDDSDEYTRVRHLVLPTMDAIVFVYERADAATLDHLKTQWVAEITHVMPEHTSCLVVAFEAQAAEEEDSGNEAGEEEAEGLVEALSGKFEHCQSLTWAGAQDRAARQAVVDAIAEGMQRKVGEDGRPVMPKVGRVMISPRTAANFALSATLTHADENGAREEVAASSSTPSRKRKREQMEDEGDGCENFERSSKRKKHADVPVLRGRPFGEVNEVCGIVGATVGSVTRSGRLLTPSGMKTRRRSVSQGDHLKLMMSNAESKTVTEVIRQRAASQAAESLSPRRSERASSYRARERMRETLGKKYGQIIYQ